jgi:hypothetical protein
LNYPFESSVHPLIIDAPKWKSTVIFFILRTDLKTGHNWRLTLGQVEQGELECQEFRLMDVIKPEALSEQGIIQRLMSQRDRFMRFCDKRHNPGAPFRSSLVLLLTGIGCAMLSASEPPSAVTELISSSCLDCHDSETETRLDFDALKYQMDDTENFRIWERVFDQVDSGAMPPKKKSRPDPELRKRALRSLENELKARSRAQQARFGRAGWRRLTNLEFENTLHELLSITTPIQDLLPSESTAGFNSSIASREISAAHIQGCLKATDRAIDSAIALQRSRRPRVVTVNYPESRYMKIWHDKPWARGGDNTRPLEDAVVAFKRTDFIWRTDRNGFKAKLPGRYRLTGLVRAYQTRSTVSFLLYKAHGGGQSQPSFLKAFDLEPNQARTIELTVELDKDEYLLPSFSNLLPQPDGRSLSRVGAKEYLGEGIAVKTLTIEGPLRESKSSLIADLVRKDFDSKTIELPKIMSLLKPFMTEALRRPLKPSDLDLIKELVTDQLESGKPATEIMLSAMRNILTSPQFLYFDSDPGRLDDFALADRLSYFLWKSPPDVTLRDEAEVGQLHEAGNLREQVDRLIDSPRFRLFVRDFAAQWLRLEDIDATTPDDVLYPEYNDVLRQAMLDETVYYLEYLFRENLDVTYLIDADFTFLNRELASLYNLTGVKGQHMRRHPLPKFNPRGGLLAQAAIHKVTANGTATSPVRRGNFVLSQLLGMPSPPPPPEAGTLEPDIRGATTVRERLEAHRQQPSCNRCHQFIDPPGFALESFDPIGRFRVSYRQLPVNGKANRFVLGLAVDSSGVTSSGRTFNGFSEFKVALLREEKETGRILRNLTEQLVVYATGTEIQFADRDRISEIVETIRSQNGGLRNLLHLIIQSKLFTHR